MKNLYFYLTIVLFFCVTQVVNAQYGYGSRRGQQRSYRPTPMPSNQNSIELKDPHESMTIVLSKCVETFKLDDFEKEITKGLLLKRFESQNVIFADKDGNLEERKKKFLEIDKVFYKDLASILSTEEIEEFKTMNFSETKEEKKKKKKDKKRKRKKGES
jgi:hypothetical protein